MTVTTNVVWEIDTPPGNEYEDVFSPFVNALIESGKTDGEVVRVDSDDGTQKTITRTWADMETANSYFDLIQQWNPVSTQATEI